MLTTTVPKVSLGDVMILVAATALSLSIYILLDNGLFNGQRFFFGLLGPTQGLNTLQLISRVGGALSILLILFGGWTLVLPVLLLCRHRSHWRRLRRQPGISACIAAVMGLAIWAGIVCGTLWLRDLFEGYPGLPPAFWIRSPVFDGLIVCAGIRSPLSGPCSSSREHGDRTSTDSTGSVAASVSSGSLPGPHSPHACC